MSSVNGSDIETNLVKSKTGTKVMPYESSPGIQNNFIKCGKGDAVLQGDNDTDSITNSLSLRARSESTQEENDPDSDTISLGLAARSEVRQDSDPDTNTISLGAETKSNVRQDSDPDTNTISPGAGTRSEIRQDNDPDTNTIRLGAGTGSEVRQDNDTDTNTISLGSGTRSEIRQDIDPDTNTLSLGAGTRSEIRQDNDPDTNTISLGAGTGSEVRHGSDPDTHTISLGAGTGSEVRQDNDLDANTISLGAGTRSEIPQKDSDLDFNNISPCPGAGSKVIQEDSDSDANTSLLGSETGEEVMQGTQKPNVVPDMIVVVVSAGLVLATLAIIVRYCGAGQGPQSSSQSEVCIDDVNTNWRTLTTEHLHKKLEKRTRNGVPQVCAKTQDQLSALMEMTMSPKKIKPEMNVPQGNSQTFTPVSAHKLLQAHDIEFNNIEPTVVRNRTDYARLNPDTNNHIEHSSGVTVTKNSLLIQFRGLYHVYVGVYFKPKSDRPVRDFKYKTWNVYLYRENANSPQRNRILLQVVYTVCDNCSINEKTSFAGGSFYLEAGDHIYVSYELLGVLKFNTESTFLGLMMVDN